MSWLGVAAFELAFVLASLAAQPVRAQAQGAPIMLNGGAAAQAPRRSQRLRVRSQPATAPAQTEASASTLANADARKIEEQIERLRQQLEQASAPRPVTPPEKAAAPPEATAAMMPLREREALLSTARSYCDAVMDRAREARAARIASMLSAMEQKLAERIDELDRRAADLKLAQDRQDEARRKADESLIAIYSRLEPEVAAAQLGAMDEKVAAAVLSKLPPKIAGAILNDVPPVKAARLSELLGSTNERL